MCTGLELLRVKMLAHFSTIGRGVPGSAWLHARSAIEQRNLICSMSRPDVANLHIALLLPRSQTLHLAAAAEKAAWRRSGSHLWRSHAVRRVPDCCSRRVQACWMRHSDWLKTFQLQREKRPQELNLLHLTCPWREA